jgi:nitroreductase
MSSIVSMILMLGIAGGDVAPTAQTPKLEAIQLPAPKTDGGVPLMQALKQRRSMRAYADRKLTPQQLSDLLWAANGVSRNDGKHTAPAALNVQAVDLYVVLPEGTYLYEASPHRLAPVKVGDHRQATGRQDFVSAAPVALVFVVDMAKFKDLPEHAKSLADDQKIHWALISAGCQSQNVSLYCASEGLGTVVRGSIDSKTFAEAAGLRPDQAVLFAQTVGWPK